MSAKDEKNWTKFLGKLLKTEKVEEFWQISEKVLDGTPLWFKVSQIKKEGAEKQMDKLIQLFLSADKHDGMPEPEGIKQLGERLNYSFNQGDYSALASIILILTLRNIAKEKNIDLPEKPEQMEIDKTIIPQLSTTAILPFYLLSALNFGRIANKINQAAKNEQEYYLALLFGLFIEMEEILHIEGLIYLTNPKRKKRKAEFIDSDRKVMSAYYDLQESQLRPGQLKKQLQKLIEKDPDFYDSYQDLAAIYIEEDDDYAANELLKEGFRRALGRIVDAEGNWPENMPWGWLENRHLIRMLDRFAFDLWGQGYEEYALYLYKRLLESNPNDNIGARYNILAIDMGYGPGEVEDEFLASREGFVDAIKLDEWFSKNAPDFPEDLGWWLEGEKQ